MKCPKCGNEETVHSRRRGIEKPLRFFYPFSPFRCKECWRRFWRFKNPFHSSTSKIIAVLIVLFFVLPFFLFRSPPKDNLKPININTERISGDTNQKRPLSSETQAGKTPKQPDHEKMAYFRKSISRVGPETVPKEKPKPTEAVKKKTMLEEEKEADHRDRGHETKVFCLHVNSFKQKINAEKRVNKLKKYGYKAFFTAEEISGQNWFRVYLCEFYDEKEARKVGSELRGKGIISYFKPIPIGKSTLISHDSQNPAH